MQFYEQVESSIVKKFRRSIWLRFLESVKEYRLIEPGDRIAACISGGKDSMLLAKCLQHLQKYSDFPFTVEYLVMDPGYNAANRQRLLDNAEALRLPIHVFASDIFDTVSELDSPCYRCARMRRGYLYREAGKLGCNKIALGHHYDDVIETVLMSTLYSGQFKTMMPKLRSTRHPGMQLIRPLYRVREADIIAWRDYNGLRFIRCACRFTENCVLGDNGAGGKREEVKQLLRRLRQNNPHIDDNLMNSIHSVNLETVIGWRHGDERHSFLDDYDTPAAATDTEE